MKMKMKMNNYLILLLILFIVLLFLVYYYKYLRKQQFESFSQLTTEERTKELRLKLVQNNYITSDFLDCDGLYDFTVINRSTEKGDVSFSTVDVPSFICSSKIKQIKQFKYSIGSEDLSNLQDDNVKNITIQITYKTNEKIINQEYIISTKIKK